MKVLIVSQYFYPETFIINDLAIELEKLGIEVEILTGKPNYPDGKIFRGYRVLGIQKEGFGSRITVNRIPLWPRFSGGALNLVLNYASFVISGLTFGVWALRRRSFDVIFVFTPSPITAAVPAIALKYIKNAKLILWVQDLWPESLSATGFVKKAFLLKAVKYLVRGIYAACDTILVQSKAFFDPIRKISPKSNILFYPNSYKRIASASESFNSGLAEILDNNFCFVFAGNIGTAQSVQTILEAAKLVKSTPDIKIIFVGSGSMLNWIDEAKKNEGLDNVVLAGRVSPWEISFVYSKAKVLLLTLKSDEIFTYTLPWKTQSYLASARPILGAINGEGARVIREAECGVVGPAEDFKSLAENIMTFYRMKEEERSIMGKNGLKYFEENFEMVQQTEKLVSLFKQMN